jgi:hypothetical protein
MFRESTKFRTALEFLQFLHILWNIFLTFFSHQSPFMVHLVNYEGWICLVFACFVKSMFCLFFPTWLVCMITCYGTRECFVNQEGRISLVVTRFMKACYGFFFRRLVCSIACYDTRRCSVNQEGRTKWSLIESYVLTTASSTMGLTTAVRFWENHHFKHD